MEREEAADSLPAHWLESPVFWSCLIFALAWTLRMLSLYYIQPFGLGLDEKFYIENAKRYAYGKSFNSEFFMPGWPWILSWFARINTSVFFLRHCPVLLGSITVLLVYHLGRRVFSEKTGRVAALMLAVYPDHLLSSALLQAETAIEVCTVAVTVFAFWERPWRDMPVRDMVSSFFFGAVVLVKHFIGIQFAGFLLSRSYSRRHIPTLAALCACFFIPIVLHGAYMGFTGRDPFAVINSPLKSASEWGKAFYKAPDFTPGRSDRVERLKEHLDWLKNRPVADTTNSIRKNLENLWSPGTFSVRRLLAGDYAISPGRWFVDLDVTAYAIVLALGTFGMAFFGPSPFRRFSVLSLVFLTSMSLALYMVSRYRESFVFVFFLFGADVLVQSRQYRYNVKNGGWPPRVACAAGLAFLGTIYLARINHLNWYQ